MFKGTLRAMLYVRNVGASVAFYQDKLGWKVKNVFGDDYAMVHASGEPLGLHATDGDPVNTDGKILYIEVANADKYHAQLAGAGAQPTELRDEPWGERNFYVKDPDGHQWGFYHPLGRPKAKKKAGKAKAKKTTAAKAKTTKATAKRAAPKTKTKARKKKK
jgi:uncharacterized glyoxalase superfamily protein PhnB